MVKWEDSVNRTMAFIEGDSQLTANQQAKLRSKYPDLTYFLILIFY